jgi:hypothetical protein
MSGERLFWLLPLVLQTGCGTWVSELELSALDRDSDGVLSLFDCDDWDRDVGSDRVWLDRDRDGYGDPSTGGGCDTRVDYVGNDLDCLDTDGSRSWTGSVWRTT